MTEANRRRDLEALRRVAQADKLGGDGRWSYRAFRRVSIHLTRLLVRSSVTPNQVTVASIAVALAGLVLVSVGSTAVALAGYALLIVYHLLDRVDGELARAKRIQSLKGIYLDNMGHYLTGWGVFAATTVRIARGSESETWLWVFGMVVAFAAVLLRVEKHAPFHIFSQYVVPGLDYIEEPRTTTGALTRASTRAARSSGSSPRRSWLAVLRDLGLAVTAFPAVVAMLSGAAVLELTTGSAAWSSGGLVVAGVLQLIALAALEYANLTSNLVDEITRMGTQHSPKD